MLVVLITLDASKVVPGVTVVLKLFYHCFKTCLDDHRKFDMVGTHYIQVCVPLL